MEINCRTILLISFVKQKTAYELRISDWSSDVCSSDLPVDDRDGEPGAILARNAVDKARRIIFDERREIEPQRRDERRAIGHAGIGVGHPVARRLDVDRAARRLKMRRETRSDAEIGRAHV